MPNHFGMNSRPSSLSALPPEDVLSALRAARAGGAATNFGPYDQEEAQQLTRGQRTLRGVAKTALVVAAVVLAGLYVFPIHTLHS